MDKDTVLFLITIVGCFIGVGGWLTSRDKRNANDSEWKGVINTKLDQVVSATSDLPMMAKEITEISESSKSAHKRIDRLEIDFRDKLKS